MFRTNYAKKKNIVVEKDGVLSLNDENSADIIYIKQPSDIDHTVVIELPDNGNLKELCISGSYKKITIVGGKCENINLTLQLRNTERVFLKSNHNGVCIKNMINSKVDIFSTDCKIIKVMMYSKFEYAFCKGNISNLLYNDGMVFKLCNNVFFDSNIKEFVYIDDCDVDSINVGLAIKGSILAHAI